MNYQDSRDWRTAFGAILGELESQWLPSWLPKKRWYQGKSRAIKRVELLDGVPLDDASLGSTILLMVGVETDDDICRLYQVPLRVVSTISTSPGVISEAVLGRFVDADAGERMVLDALALPDAPQAMLHLIQSESTLSTERGSFSGRSTSAFSSLAQGRLEPVRLSAAEQSHSNVIFGDRLLLKVFREQSVGQNPDIEILRFLTERTTFRNMPVLAGSICYEAENLGRWSRYGSDSAMFQQFVPSRGQGWEWMLARLGEFYDAALAGVDEATESARRATTDDVTLLARRTAELHRALESVDDDPNFAPEPVDSDDWNLSAEAITSQAAKTQSSLKNAAPGCTADVVELAKRLLRRVPHWLANHDRQVDFARMGRKHRIHGDLHLGQTLRTDDDFLFLDFEGEPSKPINERRRKQSALRDVAGMVRSFDYAAHAALDAAIERFPSQSDRLCTLAQSWSTTATTRFVNVYATHAIEQDGTLTADRRALLDRLLVEKALYELDYELNNRPTWASIPLRGLDALLAHTPN